MALRCLLGRRSLLVALRTQAKLGFCGGGGGSGSFPSRNYSDHHGSAKRPKIVFPRPLSRCGRPLSDFGRAGGLHPYGGSLSDPEVINASESAIEQYNKQQNKKLEFVQLLKASYALMCGPKYYLTLMARDNGVTKKYEVAITEDASNYCALVLNSFKLVADSHEI